MWGVDVDNRWRFSGENIETPENCPTSRMRIKCNNNNNRFVLEAISIRQCSSTQLFISFWNVCNNFLIHLYFKSVPFDICVNRELRAIFLGPWNFFRNFYLHSGNGVLDS